MVQATETVKEMGHSLLIDDRVQLTDEIRETPEFKAMRERVKRVRQRRKSQASSVK